MTRKQLLEKRHMLVVEKEKIKRKYLGKRNCQEREEEYYKIAFKKSDVKQALKKLKEKQ